MGMVFLEIGDLMELNFQIGTKELPLTQN